MSRSIMAFGNAALLVVILLFIGGLVLSPPHAQAKPKADGDELVETARAAYEACLAAYETETVGVEDIYRWSRRLLESRIAATADKQKQREAIRAHVNSMRTLYRKTKSLFDVAARGGQAERMYATKFYWLEAKRMLADFEAKQR